MTLRGESEVVGRDSLSVEEETVIHLPKRKEGWVRVSSSRKVGGGVGMVLPESERGVGVHHSSRSKKSDSWINFKGDEIIRYV